MTVDFWKKMHNEGLIKPSSGDTYLMNKFNVGEAPPPYDDTVVTTPNEIYTITVYINGVGTIANKMTYVTERLMGASIPGWTMKSVSPVGANGVAIELEETGSLIVTAALIITGILAVVFVTGAIAYTIVRLSDNKIIEKTISIIDAINEAEKNGNITPEQANDARSVILGITTAGGSGGTGGTGGITGFADEISQMLPLIIIMMMLKD